MQAKSIELAKTNEQSLQMLDGLRAEIGKMAKELEEVKAVPERDPELDEKLEVSSGHVGKRVESSPESRWSERRRHWRRMCRRRRTI